LRSQPCGPHGHVFGNATRPSAPDSPRTPRPPASRNNTCNNGGRPIVILLNPRRCFRIILVPLSNRTARNAVTREAARFVRSPDCATPNSTAPWSGVLSRGRRSAPNRVEGPLAVIAQSGFHGPLSRSMPRKPVLVARKYHGRDRCQQEEEPTGDAAGRRQLAAGRLQLAESMRRETRQRLGDWAIGRFGNWGMRGAKSKAQSGKRRRRGAGGRTQLNAECGIRNAE